MAYTIAPPTPKMETKTIGTSAKVHEDSVTEATTYPREMPRQSHALAHFVATERWPLLNLE